jgi:hypothetical protein
MMSVRPSLAAVPEEDEQTASAPAASWAFVIILRDAEERECEEISQRTVSSQNVR